MPKANRSKQSLPRVPISEEVYVYARSCRNVKDTAHKLICSQVLAGGIRRGDRTLRVTPLELASMELQVQRLTSLTALRGMQKLLQKPSKKQLQHIDLMRSIAKFAAENSETLNKLKRRSKVPRLYSAVAWHRPLYQLTDLVTKQIIPHLRQTWHDFPECRTLLFEGTGFEEKYITPYYRTFESRKPRDKTRKPKRSQ